MNPLFKEIRHHPLIWLLVVVPAFAAVSSRLIRPATPFFRNIGPGG